MSDTHYEATMFLNLQPLKVASHRRILSKPIGHKTDRGFILTIQFARGPKRTFFTTPVIGKNNQQFHRLNPFTGGHHKRHIN
jgi:hypothetical protein